MSKELEIWKENMAMVRKTFAPTLTDIEFNMFVELGRSLNLNPFNREIWATKYGNQCSIFVGRDGYRRIAQEQKEYDGHIVEAIYEKDEFEIIDGKITHKFNFMNRGQLMGAYCEVYRKDLSKPIRVIVRFDEYNQAQSLWLKKKETMIKKVAEAQALRMAFQGIFKGTYDESENWNEEKEIKVQPVELIAKDTEPEKLYSELETVLEEKFNSGAISEKLYEKLLADGMRLSRGSGDPEALRLMIENAKQMKKVDPVKPVVKGNFTPETPAEKPEIKAEIPKPDSLLTTMNNLKTQIETYLDRLLRHKQIDLSQVNIFREQVLTCNTVPQLTDKLQELAPLLIHFLRKRVNEFYISLKYGSTHKANSVKEHLKTETIEECEDIELLWKLAGHLYNKVPKQPKKQ